MTPTWMPRAFFLDKGMNEWFSEKKGHLKKYRLPTLVTVSQKKLCVGDDQSIIILHLQFLFLTDSESRAAISMKNSAVILGTLLGTDVISDPLHWWTTHGWDDWWFLVPFLPRCSSGRSEGKQEWCTSPCVHFSYWNIWMYGQSHTFWGRSLRNNSYLTPKPPRWCAFTLFKLSICGRETNPAPPSPENVCLLIPRTCEPVTRHGQGGFAEGIRFQILGYPGGGRPDLQGPWTGRWEAQLQKRGCGRRSRNPKTCGRWLAQSLEEGRRAKDRGEQRGF